MKDILFIIPVFNDWGSLKKLIKKIDINIKDFGGNHKILIINDCSTIKPFLKIKKLNNIHQIKLLNLKKNVGSQKAIFIALKYIEKIKKNLIISILDSDGEDDPDKLSSLINLAIIKKNYIIVANRIKRQENFFLKFLNRVRIFLTFLITGKYINFGNFSSFNSLNLKQILSNNNAWLAYSACIKKNCKNITSIDIEKKKRYLGFSKVNFYFLFLHSIKIISVFTNEIFYRSLILISLVLLINNKIFLPYIILIIILFNFFLFIFRKKNELNKNPLKLIDSVKII